MKTKSLSPNQLLVAVIVGVTLALYLASVLASVAFAAEPCSGGGWPNAAAVSAAPACCPDGVCPLSPDDTPLAVGRVIGRGPTGTGYQTGWLAYSDPARDYALVATAAHLFRDRVDKLTVTFAGKTFPARVVHVDPLWDVAYLSIPRPAFRPLVIASGWPRPGEPLFGFGYTAARETCGRVSGSLGLRVGPRRGQPLDWLQITAPVPQGFSGGPIVNRRGEVVGMIATTDHTSAMGPVCTVLHRILEPIVGVAQRIVGTEPPARRPLVPVRPSAKAIQPPSVPSLVPMPENWADFVPRNLSPPTKAKSDSQPKAVVVSGLPKVAKDVVPIVAKAVKVAEAGWLAGLLPAMPAWVTAAATVAGFSCPPAGAAGLALWWLIRRRRAKRGKGAAADAVGSFPRDDTEAAQFLQLSRSEGRSPLHDALVGRLAYDELQNTIDRKPSGPEADYARALRQRLKDRFNEMAPLALEPQAS